MSRSLNKVQIIGYLGADPETRALPSGSMVANIRVATSEQWKDRQSGENQERTEWHRISAFGKLAEIMGEYLRKGAQVYIEGKLTTRKWQDKQGNDRYSTDIVADQMLMLGGRGGGGGSRDNDEERGSSRRSSSGGSRRSQEEDEGGGQQGGGGARTADDLDDDIPF